AGLARCAVVGPRARACGSVNTLLRVGGDWHGDSTDGPGLLRDLRRRSGFDPTGADVLLLGAGGAARAVAFALAGACVRRLTIANRTHARAEQLASLLAPGVARACAWDRLDGLEAPCLVVNATAAGHAGSDTAMPTAPVSPHTRCYDLSY